MSLNIETAVKQHFFGSIIDLYLFILDDSNGTPVTGQSPTVAVRRASDGFFFDGSAFVDTSGVPTNLSMSEVGAVAVPGLYLLSITDPGPVIPTPPAVQLSKDKYELRFVNSGAPPAGGTMYDIREISRQLRDINTQGS